jgi:hypothetical protein
MTPRGDFAPLTFWLSQKTPYLHRPQIMTERTRKIEKRMEFAQPVIRVGFAVSRLADHAVTSKPSMLVALGPCFVAAAL